jgi:hypothetical protein
MAKQGESRIASRILENVKSMYNHKKISLTSDPVRVLSRMLSERGKKNASENFGKRTVDVA